METVIHVALEVASAMKPRAGTNEAVPVKPFRTVVASGSTGVGSDVIVTIWTVRSYSDVDADLSSALGVLAVKPIPATAANTRNVNPRIKFTSQLRVHFPGQQAIREVSSRFYSIRALAHSDHRTSSD
jgi:hypothetical protein